MAARPKKKRQASLRSQRVLDPFTAVPEFKKQRIEEICTRLEHGDSVSLSELFAPKDPDRLLGPAGADPVGHVLHMAHKAGFVPPLYWSTIGADGSMIMGEYRPGPRGKLEVVYLPERVLGEISRPPIFMTVVDSEGRNNKVAFRTGAPQ